MKIFLSSDMEGTAGVVDWEQCVGDGPQAAAGRRLLLDEVNAAIEGAIDGGACEIVVNDSHSTMRNLPPDAIAGQASYISGSHKPLYMMQGLDASFDAVLFVSYHGSVGASAGLSHTYNPRAVVEARINDVVTGEAGINALVAAHHGVSCVPAAKPPPFTTPVRLDVSVRTTDIAEAATWVRGVERAGPRELRIEGDDLLAIYRSFCSAILLTRSIAEAV